jgi:tRNA(Ile)-lysidine synthase
MAGPGGAAAPGAARTVTVPALLGRCTFPPPGSALTCAVSGGADSLALMALAVAAGCDVTAVHVDHGLRVGSAADGAVVADAAVRLGARFRGVRVDVGPGPNLEARARAARLAALPSGSATGHTMDDQAETVLVNLLRGAGLDGLAGMRPGPGHPLLGIRRSETRALCVALGLEPVEDPSNADPRFVRNRVRHELLPLANAIAGRDLVPVLARQALLLADEAGLLDELAAGIDPADAEALGGAPSSLARRATRRWLRGPGPHPPDLAAVERVLAVARGQIPATDVAPGVRVRRTHGSLSKESVAAETSGSVGAR